MVCFEKMCDMILYLAKQYHFYCTVLFSLSPICQELFIVHFHIFIFIVFCTAVLSVRINNKINTAAD